MDTRHSALDTRKKALPSEGRVRERPASDECPVSSDRPVRISFFTLACRLNQSDTAVLEGVARERGFRVVDFKSPADIAVINSCTVTERSDADARAAIRQAVRINPHVRVAIIGCQAQVQKDKLLALPNVCWVIGTAKKMDLLAIISSEVESRKSDDPSDIRHQTSDNPKLLITSRIHRKPFTLPLTKEFGKRTRANLKIQDGCDNFCAYCEVPFARGRSRDRDFNDLLAEGRALAAAGHKEIVLTGVNVADYHDHGRNLLDVVASLEKIKEVIRIRISSIEDAGLALDLARFMKPPHKLCRFLHIPLQSGSDRILKRMGRKSLTKDFETAVRKLVRQVPGIMIGTDVIVGFPGETDADFKQTRRFLQEVPAHYFHVFSYSHRNRARSRQFKGEVPQWVITERSCMLRTVSEKKHAAFLQSLIGSRQQVLFEQRKKDFWVGHTNNYVTIKTNSNSNLNNIVVDVVPVKVEGHSLLGRMCRED
jgi:threonylcarbamoyladenosine tRNA methylthiotransferase MtaB